MGKTGTPNLPELWVSTLMPYVFREVLFLNLTKNTQTTVVMVVTHILLNSCPNSLSLLSSYYFICINQAPQLGFLNLII